LKPIKNVIGSVYCRACQWSIVYKQYVLMSTVAQSALDVIIFAKIHINKTYNYQLG